MATAARFAALRGRVAVSSADMSAESGDSSARAWTLPALAGGLLVLAGTASVTRRPALDLVTLVPDDAYFYLKTAWHLALGHGATFDGLNPTNGYHPLYLGLLALVSMLVPLEGGRGLVAVFWLDALLTVAWLAVMTRLAAAWGWRPAYQWALVGLLLPIVAIGDVGMEVNLLLPLAWATVLAASRAEGEAAAEWRAGLLGALTCATRLDAVGFVGFAAVAAVFGRRGWPWPLRAGDVWSVVRLVAPSFVTLGGLALMNLVVFGRPTTVSSWLKAGQQPELAAIGGRLDASPQNLVLLLAVVVSALALGRAAATRTPAAWRLGVLGAWAAAYVAAMAVLLRGGLEAWYFGLPVSVAVFAGLGTLAHVCESRLPRLGRAAALAAGLLGVVAASVAVRAQMSRTWFFADGVAIGEWMDATLPADARAYMVDNSGIVAYFARRPVVNGDGLINGWDYQRELRAGRLPEYLQALRVGYLVFDEADRTTVPEIPVPLWNQPAVTLYFATPPADAARRGRFIVWAIDPRSARVTAPGEPPPGQTAR